MLKANYSGSTNECGCDEAGRKHRPEGFSDATLNDSKQLSARQREEIGRAHV